MREKFIQIIVILVVFALGVVTSLHFTKDQEVITESVNKNVTISESDSIKTAIDKIYNASVVVETYNGSSQTGAGSGFVYKKDNKYGYIITNYHVVEGARTIKIVNMSGESIEATYLGGDSYADLAVVRIDADKVLDVASIGDSTKAELGDTVFTVGTPVNSEYIGSVTKGIISGAERTITVSTQTKESYMMEVLQTDASINPGNSGGPLVNINGEVIGITSMKLVTDEIEGMGFAIPIEIAMTSVDKLEKGEKIERPYIGVTLYDASNAAMLYRYNLNLPDSITEGVVVAEVEKNMPAEEAGLKVNDVILEVDGTKVKSTAHFKFLLYKHDIGEEAKVIVNSNGKEKELTIKLTEKLGEQ